MKVYTITKSDNIRKFIFPLMIAKKIRRETNKSMETINPMGVDEAVVVGSAVRYALGRRSYAPSCVCEHIKANRQRLSENSKKVICRDIREYFEKHPDGAYKKTGLKL